LSVRDAARELNRRNIPPPGGEGHYWHPTSVSRARAKYAISDPFDTIFDNLMASIDIDEEPGPVVTMLAQVITNVAIEVRCRNVSVEEGRAATKADAITHWRRGEALELLLQAMNLLCDDKLHPDTVASMSRKTALEGVASDRAGSAVTAPADKGRGRRGSANAGDGRQSRDGASRNLFDA
jgi:hypothetical protein